LQTAITISVLLLPEIMMAMYPTLMMLASWNCRIEMLNAPRTIRAENAWEIVMMTTSALESYAVSSAPALRLFPAAEVKEQPERTTAPLILAPVMSALITDPKTTTLI